MSLPRDLLLHKVCYKPISSTSSSHISPTRWQKPRLDSFLSFSTTDRLLITTSAYRSSDFLWRNFFIFLCFYPPLSPSFLRLLPLLPFLSLPLPGRPSLPLLSASQRPGIRFSLWPGGFASLEKHREVFGSFQSIRLLAPGAWLAALSVAATSGRKKRVRGLQHAEARKASRRRQLSLKLRPMGAREPWKLSPNIRCSDLNFALPAARKKGSHQTTSSRHLWAIGRSRTDCREILEKERRGRKNLKWLRS